MTLRSRVRLLVVATCVAASAWAATAPDDGAQAAAEAWLKLIDTGNYEAAWDRAGEFFKATVTKEQWQRSSVETGPFLGTVVSRKVRSREHEDRLPKFPAGKHAVIKFDTVFRNNGAVVETVTLMLEDDGAWRPSAYLIH